jgi:tetratricopeptide (TPR) repeat protein
LLYERGIYPQSNYVFKHALTREVIYDSILGKKNKKLHEEIGNAIEQLYKGNLSEHFEVLSEHYFLSENYSKSADYSRFAGRKAEKAASFNDAIAHAKKRVTSLERLTQTEEVEKQLIDARTVLGLYIAQTNYLTEAREAIVPIIDLAVRHNYKRRLCQIYSILGSYYYFVEDNYPKTFKTLEEALKISEEVNDIVSLVLASHWYGCALGSNCEFEKSAKHFQRALDINVAARNLWGMSMIKSHMACFCYYFAGNIGLGFQTSQEAFSLAEESGDIYSKPFAFVAHALSCYGKRLLKEVEEYALKGLELCERSNLPAWDAVAGLLLGNIYFEIGDFQRSKEYCEKATWALERDRLFPSYVGLGKVVAARSKVMNKEKDVNLESLYAHSSNNKVKVTEGWIQKYMGEILLNIDNQHLSEAEHWIQRAIEADQRNRMMFYLGGDHAVYADWFKKKGDLLGAKEQLTRAIDIFTECGADGWVRKYEKEMAKLA